MAAHEVVVISTLDTARLPPSARRRYVALRKVAVQVATIRADGREGVIEAQRMEIDRLRREVDRERRARLIASAAAVQALARAELADAELARCAQALDDARAGAVLSDVFAGRARDAEVALRELAGEVAMLREVARRTIAWRPKTGTTNNDTLP